VRTQIKIVWRPSSAETPIVLGSAADPNEATTAFHEELARLRSQQATGKLLMRNGDRAHHPLLRQPFKNHDE
jgi:hypothetical protein